MNATHYAFSDDSSHTAGCYHSLSLLSLTKEKLGQLENQVRDLIDDCEISSEFKWKKVRGIKYREAAKKIISFVFKNSRDLRVDTLIWDLKDMRHSNLPGRDDNENRVRMYYHLLSSTLSNRWPVKNNFIWVWYPDKQSCVDWDTLQDCLQNKKHRLIKDLFGENSKFERICLKPPQPSDSKNHPFIQVADLFAGIATYSYGHFQRYNLWRQKKRGQQGLFEDLNSINFSHAEKARFSVIKFMNKLCKKYSLRVSLKSHKGFYSYPPVKFINFWLYEPQFPDDRAPTKWN